MYKKLILTAALTAATVSAFAGGYVTNTNQNVAFLRNPAQNAVIGVQGAYFNPAGAAFMNNGWPRIRRADRSTEKIYHLHLRTTQIRH